MAKYEEYSNTTDDSESIGRYDNQNWWIAMTFTVGTVGIDENHNVTSIKIKCKKTGNPGDLTIGVRAVDGGGKPTGEDLCSGTILAADLPTVSTDWAEATMETPYELQASTQYAIVCRVASGSGTDYVFWDAIDVGGYGGGIAHYSSNAGGSWAARATKDMFFEEWGEPLVTFKPRGSGSIGGILII